MWTFLSEARSALPEPCIEPDAFPDEAPRPINVFRNRRDGLALAVVGALVVAGFVFLDPDALGSTLLGGALLLVAALAWVLAGR